MIEYADSAELVEHLFRLSQGAAVFLEVGAYRAEFSVRAAAEYPQARIVAVEANPYTWDIVAPGLPERIEYLCAAVCAHDGRVDFQIMSIIRGAHVAQIAGNNGVRQRADDGIEYERVTQQAYTIDTILRERDLLGEPCVMWIDVEGAQDLVLAGADAALANCQALMIEVEEHPYWQGQVLVDDIDALLESAGLTCIARDREFPDQHNRIYVPRLSPTRGSAGDG